MKQLPIGIQSFEEIISRANLYIDKTKTIHRMLKAGKYFFLSRPRRFGKSLLLSTIEAIYQGKEALFEGLWIKEHWDWEVQHPVLHITFNDMDYQGKGLEAALIGVLQAQGRNHSISLKETTIKSLFSELLEVLYEKYGKVVILIDEYDKPIIDYLGEEVAQAQAHQKILKNFYSILKSNDRYIEFLLITGISKFSKVGIFSDLNNLYDLTFDRHYASLLGLTEREISDYFEDYLVSAENFQEISRAALLDKLRYWYNGYSWDGKTFVYNPFSLLSFFASGQFRNYWFETGTPTFLLKLMKANSFYQLDKQEVNEQAFSAYDIEYLHPLPILFQTGYLTIKEKRELDLYELDYPNNEVRQSMYSYILGDLRHEDPSFSTSIVVQLRKAFYSGDLDKVMILLQSVFAKIPYQIFIANKEAYYHSLLYTVFQFLNLYTVSAEVSTNRGRIDALVETPTHLYLLEFKLNESATAAIGQIKERGYPKQYADRGKPIILVGINFSEKEKSISEWESEAWAAQM